jgi:hypothetical protein
MNLLQDKNPYWGYPPDKNQSYYGLWCPVFNCFVFTHYNANLLQRIRWILTSKILTVIIKFEDHVAEQNLIDNTCCQNWTLETIHKQLFATAFKTSDINIYAIKAAAPISNLDDIIYVTKYCDLCTDWYQILEEGPKPDPMKDMTETMLGTNKLAQKQWIYKTLWLANFGTANDLEALNQTLYDYYTLIKSSTAQQ